MTEAEWLAAVDPDELFRALRGKLADRKRQLYACACCYRLWTFVADERSKAALVASERFADGQIDAAELDLLASLAEAPELRRGYPSPSTLAASACGFVACRYRVMQACFQAARSMGYRAAEGNSGTSTHDGFAAELAQQAVLLRDIFGNPFRPVAFDPAWRTDTAVTLARTMYESREFGAMPILADALQDAGCENEDVLNHCRDANQPHVRGCWVVDLVLGKE